jgi:hypothetical protein
MTVFLKRFANVVGVAAGLVACSRGDASVSTAPPAAAPDAAASASAAATASAFPIPRASVEAVLNPGELPAYDGPTGSVEGTVYVTGPAAPNVPIDARKCPAAIDTYGKLFREGTPGADGARPLGDAVVVAVGYSGFYVPEKSPSKLVTIERNCAYPTRTITLTFGQRLEVKNKSSLIFGPLLQDEYSMAVMMAPPLEAGDPVKLYPRKAGYILLTDRLQLYVHEDVYVFRHPLHTVSGTDGHYRLDGLPVGKLTIGAQHPGVGSEAEAPLEVVANVVEKLDLTLTYAPKPVPTAKPHKIDPLHQIQ